MELAELHGVPVLLDAAHNIDALRWLAHILGRDLFRAGSNDSSSAKPGRAQIGKARFPIVFACQASRDPQELLAELAPIAASLTPVEVPVMHPCPAGRIADAAQALGIPLELPQGFHLGRNAQDYAIGYVSELDPPDNSTGWIECVEYALTLSTNRYPTVICGSIYALGEILRIFEA